MTPKEEQAYGEESAWQEDLNAEFTWFLLGSLPKGTLHGWHKERQSYGTWVRDENGKDASWMPAFGYGPTRGESILEAFCRWVEVTKLEVPSNG